MSVPAQASSRQGSEAIASGSATGVAKATNVDYAIQFEFLIQDDQQDNRGIIVRYPTQPIKIAAQKDITISASASGEVSGLAALPGPLKRIVAFLLADINAKLSGGFTYTKTGAVSAVDLDYQSNANQGMTPFIAEVAKNVVGPLCHEVRSALGRSTDSCNVTVPKIADPVVAAEKLLAEASADPKLLACVV